MNKLVYALSLAVTLTACASNPDKIDAAYVSPLKYRDYTCRQLAEEMDYIGQRTTILYQRLKKEHSADNWQMGVGLILFWPVLFALEGGDGPEAAEYAQLKGEFEAARRVSVTKDCNVIAPSPEEIMNREEIEKAESDASDIATGSIDTSVTSQEVTEQTE